MAGDPSTTVERVRQEIQSLQWRGCGRRAMHHSGEAVAGDPFTTAERGCGRGSGHCSGEGGAEHGRSHHFIYDAKGRNLTED